MQIDPLHLQAMLHPVKSEEKKTALEQEIDQQIDTVISKHEKDLVSSDRDPFSGKQKLQKVKLEMEESLKLPELSEQLEAAIKILYAKDTRYLSEEENTLVHSDLETAASLLPTLNTEKISNASLQVCIKISDTSMEVIAKIALAKFMEGFYSDCFALFSLLSLLNPGNAEYWIRLGIAAYQCENYAFALRTYLAASELDPTLIGARLLAAECYIKLDKLDNAKAELVAAQAIAANSSIEQHWLDLLTEIESRLT